MLPHESCRDYNIDTAPVSTNHYVCLKISPYVDTTDAQLMTYTSPIRQLCLQQSSRTVSKKS